MKLLPSRDGGFPSRGLPDTLDVHINEKGFPSGKAFSFAP
jgi:hypothetical protein